MKTLKLALLTLLAGALSVSAETTDNAVQAKTISKARESIVTLKPKSKTAVTKGKVEYGGLAVALVKADKKLQLLNPVAPSEYGTAESSVVIDPVTRSATGLKIFSIRF